MIGSDRMTPWSLPILGNEGEAGVQPTAHRPRCHILTVEEHRARGGRVRPHDDACQLRPAGADEPGDAHDLASTDRDRDGCRSAHGPQIAGLQRDLTRGRPPTLVNRVEVAADHPLHDLVLAGLAGSEGPRGATVLEDRDPVGDGEDLVQSVRDEDDAQPFRSQTSQQFEEPLRLEPAEAGGRLVEDEDPGVLVERPCDLDQLLLRGGESFDRAVRVDADPQRGDGVGRLPSHLALVQPAAPTQLPTQVHVLHDRQMRGQAELLPDDRDALPAHPRDGGLTAKLPHHHQAATLVGQGAADDLDERRLAGAVLADERVDLTGSKLQAGIGEQQHIRAPDGPALVVVGVLLDVLGVQQDGGGVLTGDRRHVRSPRYRLRAASMTSEVTMSRPITAW